MLKEYFIPYNSVMILYAFKKQCLNVVKSGILIFDGTFAGRIKISVLDGAWGKSCKEFIDSMCQLCTIAFIVISLTVTYDTTG